VAWEFGLRRVPDAYVVLGNGQLNAFASGHGYRRFVAVNSDLFEIGGRARDPEALPELDGAQRLAVLPEETTLSKTHALLEPTLSGVIVTDLRSTNRTFVVEVGHFRELVPGRGELVARGSTVYFGQAECSIR